MHYQEFPNLPLLPLDIEQKILEIVKNPISNWHSSDELIKYTNENKDDLNVVVSQEVIDALKNAEYNPDDSLGYYLSEASNHFSNLAEFDFLEVSKEIKDWVNSNIKVDGAHISIQVMHEGKSVTPHIDEMRSYAYNYIIDTGGEVSTCFWRPKKEYEHFKIYPKTIFPYNRLDLIEEIKIQKNLWHRIDTRIIHSVENIDPSRKRISLSISIL